MRPPVPLRANTRNASLPAPISRARAHPPAIDVGIRTSGPRPVPAADPGRQAPANCEDVPGCNGVPKPSESCADVPQSPGSSNPGIRAESFRSPVHKWRSPSDSRPGSVVLRCPRPSSRPGAWRISDPGHGSSTCGRHYLRYVPQLLEHPVRSRVCSHVHVLQPPGAVLDDHEHVEHPEGDCHRHKEVAGQYGPGVVLQKRRPTLVAPWMTIWTLRHVLPDRSRRDPNSELHQQFTGDAFLTPEWVLPRHPANQGRSSGGIWGRPARHFHRQKIRQPRRCQPTMVAGLTITIASRQLKSRENSERLTRAA
jgi:hypothetical protein